MKFNRSKWQNYKIMLKLTKLQQHLPQTKEMSPKALFSMLRSNPAMLKPHLGFQGYGVIKIRRRKNGNYELHQENQIQLIKNDRDLLTILKKRMGQKKYLVQEWIPLATIDNHPFDIRVMVQRITGRPWEVTGSFVKVAPKNYVITNVALKVLPLSSALKISSLKNKPHPLLIKQINHIALSVSQHLAKYYPTITKIGFDIGVDNNGKPWVIEANFKPSISPFKLLRDKSPYKKILFFIRQNNKTVLKKKKHPKKAAA